jgi:hypothetical protein
METEIKSLGKSYVILEEKLEKCLRGIIFINQDVSKPCNFIPESLENFSKVSNKKHSCEIEVEKEEAAPIQVKDRFEDLLSVFSIDMHTPTSSESTSLEAFQPIEVQLNINDQLIFFDEIASKDVVEAEVITVVTPTPTDKEYTINVIDEEKEALDLYPPTTETLYILAIEKAVIKFEEIDKDSNILEKLESNKWIFTQKKNDRCVEYKVFSSFQGYSLSSFLHSKFTAMLRSERPRYDVPNSFYTISYNDEKLVFSKKNSNTTGLCFYFTENEGVGFKLIRNPVELKVINDNACKQNDDTGKKEKKVARACKGDIKKISTNLNDCEFESMKINTNIV